MKNYLVLGKFYSSMGGGLVTGEKVIKAHNYEINESGCVTFYVIEPDARGWNIQHNIFTMPPPPFWVNIQEVPDDVLDQAENIIVSQVTER